MKAYTWRNFVTAIASEASAKRTECQAVRQRTWFFFESYYRKRTIWVLFHVHNPVVGLDLHFFAASFLQLEHISSPVYAVALTLKPRWLPKFWSLLACSSHANVSCPGQ